MIAAWWWRPTVTPLHGHLSLGSGAAAGAVPGVRPTAWRRRRGPCDFGTSGPRLSAPHFRRWTHAETPTERGFGFRVSGCFRVPVRTLTAAPVLLLLRRRRSSPSATARCTQACASCSAAPLVSTSLFCLEGRQRRPRTVSSVQQLLSFSSTAASGGPPMPRTPPLQGWLCCAGAQGAEGSALARR